MIHLKPYNITLSVLIFSCAAMPLAASTHATVGINFSQSFPNNADTKNIDDNNPLMTATTSTASARLDSAGSSSAVSVEGYAYATSGHIGVSAITNTTVISQLIDSQGNLNGRGGATAEASAAASWLDRFTIIAPGLSGQHGSFDATLHLTGVVDINGAGGYVRESTPDGGLFIMTNDGRAYLNLAGNGLLGYTQPWDDACGGHLACALYNPANPTQSYNKGNATIDLPVIVGFTFGLPTDISYSISAYSYASSGITYYKMSGSGGVETIADMSHTLLWGGINNVYDAQGRILTAFDLRASSGFDYKNAAIVPLPAASWLFLSSLIGLLGQSKKQKSGLHPKTY